jgi:hypothetical protein
MEAGEPVLAQHLLDVAADGRCDGVGGGHVGAGVLVFA